MDYCTFFPEGWWAHCCEAHDLAYGAQVGQTLADGALALCVASSLPELAVDHPVLATVAAAGSVLIGVVMWLGVRFFGGRFYRNADK